MQANTKKSFEWRQMTGAALITFLLTLIGNLVFINYSKEKPDLIYEKYPISSFSDGKTKLSIFSVKVANIGSMSENNIICKFVFPNETRITRHSTKPSSAVLKYYWSNTDLPNERTISIPSLHVGEQFNISFFTENLLENIVKVDLRGENVLGHQKTVQSENIIMIDKNTLFYGLIMNTAMVVCLIIALLFQRMINKSSMNDSHKPDPDEQKPDPGEQK